MLFVRRTVWLMTLALIVGIAAEVMARVDDAVRSGVPILASPSYTDLTIQDSLGTRGRPFARFEKWKLNGAGFRSQEVSLASPGKCTRVAVMGASETFGYAESPGKEYPAQLADSLNRIGCYEVLNTAVTGLPTTGQIQLWENWVSRFEPNVVVIYASPAFYLSNDAPEFSKLKPRGPAPISNPFELRLMGRLKDRIDYPDFLQRRRVMKRIAHETAGKPDNWLFRTVPDDRLRLFQAHLDSLVESIRARGAVPVLGLGIAPASCSRRRLRVTREEALGRVRAAAHRVSATTRRTAAAAARIPASTPSSYSNRGSWCSARQSSGFFRSSAVMPGTLCRASASSFACCCSSIARSIASSRPAASSCRCTTRLF